jgi:ATP-dependent protease Clp ATPase subunit
MYELPSKKGIKEVVISKEAVQDNSKIQLKNSLGNL